jgi:hypothetical protein
MIDLPDPQVRALRIALRRKRERVEEWRRCRLDLTISQVEYLTRSIAADEQRLRDLEAGSSPREDIPMQPCAMPDPSLEPVLNSLVPPARPKRNRRRANPLADHNAGSVVGAALARA